MGATGVTALVGISLVAACGGETKPRAKLAIGIDDEAIEQCGGTQRRIRNGDSESRCNYPAVLWVLVQDQAAKWVFNCTSALIAPKIVLTAAHCVVDLQALRRRALSCSRALLAPPAPAPKVSFS